MVKISGTNEVKSCRIFEFVKVIIEKLWDKIFANKLMLSAGIPGVGIFLTSSLSNVQPWVGKSESAVCCFSW